MKAMLEYFLFMILNRHFSFNFSIGKDKNGMNWRFELSLNR